MSQAPAGMLPRYCLSSLAMLTGHRRGWGAGGRVAALPHFHTAQPLPPPHRGCHQDVAQECKDTLNSASVVGPGTGTAFSGHWHLMLGGLGTWGLIRFCTHAFGFDVALCSLFLVSALLALRCLVASRCLGTIVRLRTFEQTQD